MNLKARMRRTEHRRDGTIVAQLLRRSLGLAFAAAGEVLLNPTPAWSRVRGTIFDSHGACEIWSHCLPVRPICTSGERTRPEREETTLACLSPIPPTLR